MFVSCTYQVKCFDKIYNLLTYTVIAFRVLSVWCTIRHSWNFSYTYLHSFLSFPKVNIFLRKSLIKNNVQRVNEICWQLKSHRKRFIVGIHFWRTTLSSSIGIIYRISDKPIKYWKIFILCQCTIDISATLNIEIFRKYFPRWYSFHHTIFLCIVRFQNA